MTEQTKAQRLADELLARHPLYGSQDNTKYAAELRRMDANEAALVEALKSVMEEANQVIDGEWGGKPDAGESRNDDFMPSLTSARALITRIEAERNAK